MCAQCIGRRSAGTTLIPSFSPGMLNTAPKGGEAGGGGCGRKLLKCEKDTEEGVRPDLRQSNLLFPPKVYKASLLESMAPSGASCVKSCSAVEEKQIACPSSTGHHCVSTAGFKTWVELS